MAYMNRETMHDRMAGEMDRARMAELEGAQTAVAQEDKDWALSTSPAGDDQNEAVPDRAEAEVAGAAIGDAADILPTEEDLAAVLEEDSTWYMGRENCRYSRDGEGGRIGQQVKRRAFLRFFFPASGWLTVGRADP